MATTADEMHASAGRTGELAKSAADAAAQALANAQTVASAAEQLAASIKEVGGQVGQSTASVSKAVEAGRETRVTIETLNEKVRRIGSVADMISDIALQDQPAGAQRDDRGGTRRGCRQRLRRRRERGQAARTPRPLSRRRRLHAISATCVPATAASVTAVGRIEANHQRDRRHLRVNRDRGGGAGRGHVPEIARSVAETANAANVMTSRIAEVSSEADQTGRHAAGVHDEIGSLEIP